MGSRCSILNDTERNVWITHGVNWTVLRASVSVVAVLAGVAALAALIATAGVGSALLVGTGVAIMSGGATTGTRAMTAAGLTATQWSLVRRVIGFFSARLWDALNSSREEAEQFYNQVRNFQAVATLIRPGERYTWSGTLSLTKTVYVMNDQLQIARRACFTGPTHGSENVYPISQYFQQLQ